ncbi:uncharacterized protein LOC135842318 [Planococcus citri]|uniref:uncharacterized protein LOC135842318 n=1 Tax=Planococcus citri TaxID=170843 RepID=UPI0031F73638
MASKFLPIFLLYLQTSSTVLASYSDNNSSLLQEENEFELQTQQTEEDGVKIAENSLTTESPAAASDFNSIICSTFPGTCSRLQSFTRQLFRLGGFEGRGPKDLIAIVSTMLATLLGAILVKLNVLIVLSLISVGIGKILVLLLTLKSHLFAHQKTQQPSIVYEKIYYPHHKEYNMNQLPQTYQDDYSTYNLSS